MFQLRRVFCTVVAASLSALLIAGSTAAAQREEKGRKPSISLKLTPTVAIAPTKVRAAIELRGGADDYQDYYCPAIEWDWGDDTKSESEKDCDPYAAGRSTITRRFSADHTYREAGMYKVTFRMKRKDKVIAMAAANVEVQPGLSGR